WKDRPRCQSEVWIRRTGEGYDQPLTGLRIWPGAPLTGKDRHSGRPRTAVLWPLRGNGAVPGVDDGHLALPTQDADRTGLEHELGAEAGLLAQEHRREDPQAMPMTDQRHVTGGKVWHGAVDDLATPRGHLFDALASCRAGYDAAVEHTPGVPDPLADLVGGQAFIAAVVPLHEVVVGLRMSQSGQVCGAAGTLQGRGEDKGEHAAREQFGGLRPELLAPGSERHVGEPGVLAGLRPLGLAMA